ncbi:ABC transporter substrate-binding protein [Roseivirga pacifica]|uniref:ABC transporter substrate-binding protein n=1 Tax=Roseivirga pacifica TaxID=1267423 RepID=UPI003BB1A972
MKRYFLALLLVFSFSAQLSAQNVKQIFEEGKSLFDQEQYALAQGKFAAISALDQENDMVRYAAYYYAISAYRADDAETAKNMFLQIKERYPYWEPDEMNYWLGFLNAKEGNPQRSFEYLALVKNDSLGQYKEAIKKSALAAETEIDVLEQMLSEFPQEGAIASRIAELILEKPVEEQDINRLMSLEESYELKIDLGVEGIESSPKKSVYNMGLFLPFYYRSDSASLVRVERNWTSRMYYGAQLAVQKLEEEGIKVNLIPVDTRDARKSLAKMISEGELDSLDLIIGPVTESSINEVNAFSKEKQINMINPLSSNSEIMAANPFAFLYYPSNESIAIKAANYAKENFRKNKNAAVFYSGFSDKPRADLYRKLIEEDSFNVTIFEGVLPNESVKIQQLLLDEEEVDRDSIAVDLMMAEMDSLRAAGEADWEIYSERDFVYDTLRILPDSLGHIFIASDFSSLSTSALSGIDARPDTIEFLSSSRFLTAEQTVSFAQLERVNSAFTGTNHINYGKPQVAEFRQRYLNKYYTNPVREERLGDAYIGYDIVVSFGRLLHRYGKYFQVGLKRQDKIPGELTDFLEYKLSNDNRYIPYMKVRGAKVEIIEEKK